MVQPPRRPDVQPPPERAAAAVGATPEQRRFAKALRDGMRREWVTIALIVANVAVFALMAAQGSGVLVPGDTSRLVEWGANYGPATIGEGQWWRLFSSMFLHGGVLHVGFNMYALWVGGRVVERIYGHVGYALLYAFAGLLGSVASAMTTQVPSVGASGAVFGIFGALLAFLLRRRRLLPAAVLKRLRSVVLIVVGFNVAFGFAVPGIDQAAHLGGLAGGFLAGLLLAPAFTDSTMRRPWAVYPVLVLAGTAVVWWIAA